MRNAALLRRLTSTLMSTPPEAPLSERLLRGFVSVSEADGGAITIGYSRTDRTMIAFTDPIAERVEELQDFLQEAPAWTPSVPATLWQSTTRRRCGHWPLLSQSLAQDLPAVSAYPMKPYSEVLGVLTVHRRPDRPAPLEVEDASFLVNAIAVTIIGGFERSDGDDLVWSARDGIDHATGMVVAQLAVPASDALALLRAHAFAHDQALTQVADAVVSRKLNFRDNSDGRGATS